MTWHRIYVLMQWQQRHATFEEPEDFSCSGHRLRTWYNYETNQDDGSSRESSGQLKKYKVTFTATGGTAISYSPINHLFSLAVTFTFITKADLQGRQWSVLMNYTILHRLFKQKQNVLRNFHVKPTQEDLRPTKKHFSFKMHMDQWRDAFFYLFLFFS